jgi:hypothetical protein
LATCFGVTLPVPMPAKRSSTRAVVELRHTFSRPSARALRGDAVAALPQLVGKVASALLGVVRAV